MCAALVVKIKEKNKVLTGERSCTIVSIGRRSITEKKEIRMNRLFYTLLAALSLVSYNIRSSADLIQVAGKKTDTLGTAVFSPFTVPGNVNESFIAYGGYPSDNPADEKKIHVAKFTAIGPDLKNSKSEFFSKESGAEINSCSWAMDSTNQKMYLAVGGTINALKEGRVSIYSVDGDGNPDNLCSAKFPGTVYSVKFFQADNHNFYVVVGCDDQDQGANLQIFSFSPASKKLTAVANATGNFYHGMAYAVDAIETTTSTPVWFIIAAGTEVSATPRTLQTFTFDTSSNTFTFRSSFSIPTLTPYTVKWYHVSADNTLLRILVGGKSSANTAIQALTFNTGTFVITSETTAAFNNGIVHSLDVLANGATALLIAGGENPAAISPDQSITVCL
jgi:hypothetical protein